MPSWGFRPGASDENNYLCPHQNQTKKKMKKKACYLLAALTLSAATFTLAGCDDDDYYDHHWWDDYSHESWWNNNYENPSSDKLELAAALSRQWTGDMIAQYTEDGVQYTDSFAIAIEFKQADAKAAVGTATEYSWPYLNGQVLDDSYRKVRNYVWYIDDQLDIHLTFGDGGTSYDATIAYDDFKLDTDNGTFDGYMDISNGEVDQFWYDVFTRAGKPVPHNLTSVRLVVRGK